MVYDMRMSLVAFKIGHDSVEFAFLTPFCLYSSLSIHSYFCRCFVGEYYTVRYEHYVGFLLALL